MRAESNIKPSAYAVEQCGDMADIILYENIEQEERDDAPVFTYDEYRLTVPYRENLAADVIKNRAAWLEEAKAAEAVVPPPTVPEELAALKKENAELRAKNAELDNLVNIMLGGSDDE